MNRRLLASLVCCASLGAALLVSTPTSAQDCGGCCEGAPAPAAQAKKDDGCCQGAAPAGPAPMKVAGDGGMKPAPASDPATEQWMALGRPGESHKKLESMVGTFAVKASFWMEPGKAPTETTGLSVNAWALGGRFVEQKFFGTCPMGIAFEGIGYTGFDNATGKFIGTWMDSMTTGMMNSTGEACSPKTITFRSEQIGPGGVKTKTRYLIEFVSADSHKLTMFMATGDAPEAKGMELLYTRR